MAGPSFRRAQSAIQGRLRIDGGVMMQSVPHLTFEPSIGIIARDIDKLGLDIRSFREPLKRAIQQVVIPSIRKNFDVGGRPSWEPYSEGTLDIRERMNEPVGNLLVKSGQLQRVMGQVNIWDIKENSALLADLPGSVWYGKIHQQGHTGGSMKVASKKAGNMGAAFEALQAKIAKSIKSGTPIKTGSDFTIPARPFIMLQSEDLDAIERVFTLWLEERILRHWKGRR